MIDFHLFDVILFFFPFLIIGIILFFSYRKTKTTTEYFQAEGNLHWFVAGTAMVATTFAADTPLAVTEIIRSQGIVGNWVWWYMAIGGFVTVFFFAKLWKRSEAKTDLDLIRIRYSGKEAKFLQGFKAISIGLILNVIVLGWVNLAMIKILPVFFPNVSIPTLLAILLIFGLFYTSVAGLRGISYIDVFQFFLAWGGCLLFAYFSLGLDRIGGISNLFSKIPNSKLEFFPNFENSEISFSHFLILITVLWWSSWYPGSEPGGGGYIAQRILATRNESAAVKSSLWFVVAHYFVRPWPWIIVALVSLVLYPDLSEEQSGQGFLMVLKEGMPHGIIGLLLSAFLAAYLSTLATHLNWGASYLVKDLWEPFLQKNKPDRYYIKISYLLQTLIAGLSFLLALYGMETVKGSWVFLLEASSGIGFVLIARWFFWKISARTEILAFILSPILYSISKFLFSLVFPYTILSTSLSAVVLLLLYSNLFPETDKEKLKRFYEKVKPPFFFWKSLYTNGEDFPIRNNFVLRSLVGVFFGLAFVFLGLYLIQSLLTKEPSWIVMLCFLLSGYGVYKILGSTTDATDSKKE